MLASALHSRDSERRNRLFFSLSESLEDALHRGTFTEATVLLNRSKCESQQLLGHHSGSLSPGSKSGSQGMVVGTVPPQQWQMSHKLLCLAVSVKGITTADREDLPGLLRRFCGPGLVVLNALNPDGATALHIALRENHIAAATALLDLGADVSVCAGESRPGAEIMAGDLALHVAMRLVKPCSMALLRRLCGPGLSLLNFKGAGQNTPLHVALAANNAVTASFLCELGADVHIRNSLGDLPVHHVAWCIDPGNISGTMPLLRRLCGKGYTMLLNAIGYGGRTPLHAALQTGKVHAACAFLDIGASTTSRDKKGDMALHVAAGSLRLWCLPLLQRLASKDGCANSRDCSPRNCSPRNVSPRRGRDTASPRRRSRGDGRDSSVDSSHQDVELRSPSSMRGRSTHGSPLILLDAVGADDCVAIHTALRANNPLAAHCILELGADASIRDGAGDTALHAAGVHVRPCDPMLMRNLVGAAGINTLGACGRTALQAALQANNPAAASCLVDLGADVAIRDSSDNLALHIGAANVKPCITALFRLLGGRGLVHLNARGFQGCTPLHTALRANNPHAATTLLDLGADTSIRDGAGNMPLHLAASFLQPCTMALLERLSGQRLSMLNEHGEGDRTALHAALKSHNSAAAAALLELTAVAKKVGSGLSLGRYRSSTTSGLYSTVGQSIIEDRPSGYVY